MTITKAVRRVAGCREMQNKQARGKFFWVITGRHMIADDNSQREFTNHYGAPTIVRDGLQAYLVFPSVRNSI